MKFLKMMMLMTEGEVGLESTGTGTTTSADYDTEGSDNQGEVAEVEGRW